MREELKNCPFCGSENVSLEWWDEEEQNTKSWEQCDDENGAVFPYVVCRDCECNIVFAGRGYGKDVISAYNTRTPQNDEVRE